MLFIPLSDGLESLDPELSRSQVKHQSNQSTKTKAPSTKHQAPPSTMIHPSSVSCPLFLSSFSLVSPSTPFYNPTDYVGPRRCPWTCQAVILRLSLSLHLSSIVNCFGPVLYLVPHLLFLCSAPSPLSPTSHVFQPLLLLLLLPLLPRLSQLFPDLGPGLLSSFL